MMSVNGCKTKKSLKARKGESAAGLFIETSLFGREYVGDGTYCVVGPAPTVRNWYAEVTVKGGKIAKVT
jgi:hypothetical protein